LIKNKITVHYIRNFAKNFLGFVFFKTLAARKATSNSLTVFAFHDVSDQPSQFAKEHGLCISLDTFRLQCQWIKSHFNVVHPADLVNGIALPKNAALISFDDGFLGSFENGLAILEQLNLPSILFLNMASIINGTPIISAVACYLDRSVPAFHKYAKRSGLRPPFHLTLHPSALSKFQDEYGSIDLDIVTQYQGSFADLDIVKKWDAKPLVCYGNHLYEHWNAVALSEEVFEKQYKKNENALQNLRNWVNLFAFTNGQPHTCFTKKNVTILKALGAGNVFSCFSGVNKNYKANFLLGRISLGPDDNSSSRLWFRIAHTLTQVSDTL
jgi:peptidoglycan/xylan/chitin deacetylase (PgdA/CDA1 family)